MDPLNYLGTDVFLEVLVCLEDPVDLVRASAVSRSWHHMVIANGLCKKMCLRMFQHLSRVHRVSNASSSVEEQTSSSSQEWENLKTEHKVYGFLARGATKFLAASSTDNFEVESIYNTLESRDRIGETPSYWSSKGHSNPAVPETLLYKLDSDLCVVTEINIQPFQVYFQPGSLINSAKAVRFRMGHCTSSGSRSGSGHHTSPADKIVWTYTSQEFPMVQENRLQKFKLPEPALCIGGFFLIELLGRVQRHEMDGLLYMHIPCSSHGTVSVGNLWCGDTRTREL